jgi:hypothetical protein
MLPGCDRTAQAATIRFMHGLVKFFRAYPQALVLLIICVVLGLGTFVAVLFGVASSGSTTTNGYPSDDVILGLHALAGLGGVTAWL